MPFRGYRIPVVIAVAVATAALLFGAVFLYRHQSVDRPLARLFADEPAVKEYVLDQGPAGPVVRVRLDRVRNLQETYRRLEKDVDSVLPPGTLVEIVDGRDDRLQGAYDSMAFQLQEALARGTFSTMATAVQGVGARLGLDRTTLYLDGDYLYVQLEDGDRYLYAVLPRPQAQAAAGGEQG